MDAVNESLSDQGPKSPLFDPGCLKHHQNQEEYCFLFSTGASQWKKLTSQKLAEINQS